MVSTASEQLTDVNREYLREHPPARMEKFFVQREGLEIEARLWFPPTFDRTLRYPMVLDVQGAPTTAALNLLPCPTIQLAMKPP